MEFKNIEVSHLQHALRGMRNAMSGWDKSDTRVLEGGNVDVGPSDRDLARRLIKAGAPHRPPVEIRHWPAGDYPKNWDGSPRITCDTTTAERRKEACI